MPCRINRARLWSSRILIESMCHEKSSFVTLTYNPHFYSGNSLVPDDCTRWIKRVRKACHPQKVRYFLVGEYGDRTQRPHYHLALFGLGAESEDLLRSCWHDPKTGISMGHIYVGDLSPQSARYVAGYVVKKLTDAEDPRLSGRFPEFARMSQGIGKGSIEAIAKAIQPYVEKTTDVPTFLRIGGRTYPLGRYLRTLLRKALDVYTVDQFTGEVKYGQSLYSKNEAKKTLQDLFETWFNDPVLSTKSFKSYLVSLDDGKAALLKSKIENSNSRKSL